MEASLGREQERGTHPRCLGPDPEPPTPREGTGHRRPRGVGVHVRDAASPGWSTGGEGLAGAGLTLFCSYLYRILRVSMARIMACMAVKMFW